MQATTTAEEERLGVNFGDLWEERQKGGALAAVEAAEAPAEGAQQIHFDSTYATKCASSHANLYAGARSSLPNPPLL